MILIVDGKQLYTAYFKREYNASDMFSANSMKELQGYLKIASTPELEACSLIKFSSMAELTTTINTDRKSFPDVFFIKEVK